MRMNYPLGARLRDEGGRRGMCLQPKLGVATDAALADDVEVAVPVDFAHHHSASRQMDLTRIDARRQPVLEWR